MAKTDKFFPPGYSIHEVGTARMGDDPKKSVEAFVTCGWQDSTMTILALSMRASEHLAEGMRKGTV